MTTTNYDTIVVGGGIAGLTSACYLAKAGQKVLLIEKNTEVGGLVNSFKRKGFQFEAGVRALESAGIILPMLKDLGIELEIVRSKVSVGVANDILHIENKESLNAYGEMLKRNFPDDHADIDKLIRIIRKIMKHMEVLYGLENPAFKDLKNDRDYIFKQLLPWLPRFIFTVGKINRMNMPIERYLEGILKNPSLRDVVAQLFFKNTPSFFALSYFSLYLDYFYPLGGVGTIAEKMLERFLEWGGELKNETTATKVDTFKKELSDDRGNTYPYEQLVWAADLKALYKLADTGKQPPIIQKKFQKTKDRMLSRRGGDSIFSLYLMLDQPLDSFRKVANGHFFYTPSTRGLGQTHLSELQALLTGWDEVSRDQLYEWLGRFVRLNTFEISIPGLKDESLVPKEKTGMIVSFLAEYDLFDRVQKSGFYDEFRARLEELVIETLSTSVYPMMKGKVMDQFSFTPLSIANRINNSEGAITGWSFQEPVPVLHKMQHSAKSVLTPIPGIYQAGQWAYSPAGVPMSILTGKLASDKVLKNA